MLKSFFIMGLYLLSFSGRAMASANIDTLEGNMDIRVLRAIFTMNPWLSYDVDYSWKMGTPSFSTETRHYNIHNGQYLVDNGVVKSIKNYGLSFSVDTAGKAISVNNTAGTPLSVLLFFDFDNSQAWSYHIKRTYVVDSGSLRKLVVEFKPASPWESYTAVYDPANFLPKQVRYSMKQNNSSGQRADYEYICNFKNYQTTAFDEAVFSHDPYFSRENGTPVLKPAYSNYQLFIYP